MGWRDDLTIATTLDHQMTKKPASPAGLRVVGVIMTYNCARLVARAIRNVPRECFDEIICVDDVLVQQIEAGLLVALLVFHLGRHDVETFLDPGQ